MSNTPDIDEIIEEYLRLSQEGVAPDIDAFAEKYPGHAEELKELLPLVAGLDGIAPKETPRQVPKEEPLPDFSAVGLNIIRQIGRGGMGIVYEAEQVALNRHVAVKTLPAMTDSPERQRQFEVEARAIARLYHPGIVQIYSAGQCGNVNYYAMELVNGQRLDACRITDIRQIADIGLQAAVALAYAHRCGILHRDVKPSNMLLDEAGHLCIMDFGLAEIAGGGGSFSGGTLRYMSPERLEAGQCTAASDQYALGAVLYELVSGKPLFQESNSHLLAHRICTEPLPSLSCRERDFAAIVEKSMRKSPEERYSSMDAMVSDLRNFLAGKPIQAKPPTMLRRFRMWCARNPQLAVSALVAFLASIFLIVALAVGYVRTRNAQLLAERNAENAETSLRKVFDFVEKRPPSRSTTEFLVLLLPYFQEAVSQKGVSEEKLFRAWRVIEDHARRIEDWNLAENSSRKLLALKETPEEMNRLAAILRKRGKAEEADALCEEIIGRFAKAPRLSERIQAFQAMRHLAESDNGRVQIQDAFDYLKELLVEEPENSRLRFSYAEILSEYPGRFQGQAIAGIEPNALLILEELAEQEPDNPEYAIAYVRHVRRMLRNNEAKLENEVFAKALEVSGQLLTSYAYVPEAVVEGISYRRTYVERLRHAKRMMDARRESERLITLLRSSYFSADAPNVLREALLDIQLERLRMPIVQEDALKRLKDELTRELDVYNGPRKAEYLQRLQTPPKPARRIKK